VHDNKVRINEFDKGNRPDWYDRTPAPDSDYVYAVGVAREKLTESEGENVAFLDACAKMASSISVDVATQMRNTESTSGAPNLSEHGSSTSDSGSGSALTTSALASRILSGAVRKDVFKQRVEVNPSRILNIHIGTKPQNLRWDVYILVAYPKREYDIMRSDFTQPLDDRVRFREALEKLSSPDPVQQADAIHVLEVVRAASPLNERYEYELGMAYVRVKRLAEARAIFDGLARSRNSDFRNLALGQLRSIERREQTDPPSDSITLNAVSYSGVTCDAGISKEYEDALDAALQAAGAKHHGEGDNFVILTVELSDPESVQLVDQSDMVLHGSLHYQVRWDRQSGKSNVLEGSADAFGADGSALRSRLCRAFASAVVRAIAAE